MYSADYFSVKKRLILLALILIQVSSLTYPIYASSCDTESATRLCPQRDNATQYLQSLKKGGTNILATDDYDGNFFLCEQYTFDCGYVEYDNQTVSIANGIQLQMNTTEVDTILPLNTSLATEIKHYLNLSAPDAKCGMKVFPLILTAAQSELFFTNYMTILTNQIKTKYATQKMNGTIAWSDMNINIKTAVCEVIKQDKTLLYSGFWDDFKYNNFTQMSDYLKGMYRTSNQLYYLRSAYLIDSVTQRCNKLQSVSYLIDESGSIGSVGFQLALDFLTQYTNRTYDDPKLTQVQFYDSSFEQYLNFGNTKAQLLAGIASKTYRAGGTFTGDAINKTIQRIINANFDSGLNKILIVMTDGKSYDQVLAPSNYARSKGITMIAVGIGPAVNDTQLLEIAQTPANMIKVTSYADLGKLVAFIENYFCKQIIDLKLNQTIVGNLVRVPESPAYFRLEKSLANLTYILRIKYETNPDQLNQSLFSSQYDPFPDAFTEFNISESYRPSILQKVYFVYPTMQTQVRTKKSYYKVQNFSNAYLSVGGNNMKFNISLNPCNTSTCSAEKASFQSVGLKKDITPTDDKNYNIYGIIAGSIAGLLCLSLLGAMAIKKLAGGDDSQAEAANQTGDNKLQPQLTEQDLNDQIKSAHSGGSQHSGKSGHSEKSGHSGKSKGKKSQKGKEQSHDEEMDSRKSGQSNHKKPLKGKK